MADDTKYWVAFNRIPGIGRARCFRMMERFGSLDAAWLASQSQLAAAGLDEKSVLAIMGARPRISPDAEMERLEQHGVRALLRSDPAYPFRLKEIYDPPAVLYVKGTIEPEDDWCITLVGTRRVTAYGREVTQRLSRDLARNGITIISGLALGVDGIAHQSALDVGGRTIAIVACGLDMVYPPSHAALAAHIAEHGAVISDYPLGVRPKPEYFPRRNRILAGISMGTVVVEAPEKSGALITARFALEENREVFAVPGSILSPASRGTNRLVQDGAKAVLDYRDIMEELNLRQPQPQQVQLPGLAAANATEASILGALSQEPAHIDEIRRGTGLPVAEVSGALAVMELRGLVRQTGAMTYVRIREDGVDYPGRLP